MADDETPAEWWVKEMLEDADMDRVVELSGNILDCCFDEEKYSRSLAYAALGRAFAIILMDAGRSGARLSTSKKQGV